MGQRYGCGWDWSRSELCFPAAHARATAEPRGGAGTAHQQRSGALALPVARTSVKFAVIGDSGRGWRPQHEVAARMVEYRSRFPFSFVLMAGDNIYEGPATPADYRLKFEEPYRVLLDAGVKFYAVLGNHDDPLQRFYPRFNMEGQRYYTFRPPSGLLARLAGDVQVFAFDSTNLDNAQLVWARRELARSHARWKIALLHHPPYSPGRYQAQARLTRWQIESTLVGGHVDAVFSGHEHLFARMKPQQGVQYSSRARRARCARGMPGRGLRSRAVSTTTSTSCSWKSTATRCTCRPSRVSAERWMPPS